MKQEKVEKIWDNLTISNDFLFAKVMGEEEICKEVIEALLNVKVGKIEYVEYQKSINISYEAKSVRLDVYTQDENRMFNLEIQIENKKDLPKRSRYYQSMIDLNAIEKGEYYKNLKESYVVFICTFDPFEKGLAKYSFHHVCDEDSTLLLEDGTHRMFFNTTANHNIEDKTMQAFLQYVNGEKSNHELICKIEERVNRIKGNEYFRREFMTLLMKLQENREEGFEEGVEVGIERGIEQGIYAMIRVLSDFIQEEDVLLQKIADEFSITWEDAKQYYRKYLEQMN
ncbi:MAG: Rpn family recombination-promoting nuclease/putative transposase [Eubacteriales bacterium]